MTTGALEVDLLVAGSGAGGLTAAFAAHERPVGRYDGRGVLSSIALSCRMRRWSASLSSLSSTT